MRKPDPRLIVSTLDLVVLDSQKKNLQTFLTFTTPLACISWTSWTLKNVKSRERILVKLTLEESWVRFFSILLLIHTNKFLSVVLGEPLRKTSIYALMTMVLGGA